MKALLVAMGAGVPALMLVMGMAIAGSGAHKARTPAPGLEHAAAMTQRPHALTSPAGRADGPQPDLTAAARPAA